VKGYISSTVKDNIHLQTILTGDLHSGQPPTFLMFHTQITSIIMHVSDLSPEVLYNLLTWVQPN